ncbi:caspase recruitment domain-containing protein 8-like [Clupea harengus]|uniref:Caspase recruitment domain-containing protein 8-like n=1 Tax=Clupea harengus TaxID=7950 RepID=A0A6P8F2D3_CLUHA|nr:caspase recruitment domain-containing protein 8-like [Clupea harengus]
MEPIHLYLYEGGNEHEGGYESVWETKINLKDLQKRGTSAGHGFFKKHKGELEVRLGVLAPLLIDLERNIVLTALEREEVQSRSTRQEKNYTLMSILDRRGSKAQDRFYEALKAHDPLLVEDLEQSAM